MKKLVKILSFSLISLVLISCDDNKTNNIYGERINEDLSSINIQEDNYRNYYEIFVGSFYDSNNDGMGDLDGVTSKISYIKNLGYTGIWLMPIFESDSYHKYDTKDYYSIDTDYGTMDDLKELIEECHENDIKIIIDLAINHNSFNNNLFKESASAYNKFINNETLTESEEKYKDLYSFSKTQEFNYTQVPGYNFYVEENFQGGGMPEFNFDSPFTMEIVKNIMKTYLDLGIDGFRLDAVKYYDNGNTSHNVEILSEISNYAKNINPNSYIVGECWDNDALIKSYYESDLDSYFLFSASTGSNSFITRSTNLNGLLSSLYLDGAKTNLEISNGHIPAPFIDNHDMARATQSGNLELTKFYYGLLSMLNGTTFTYYGDEIGLTGTVNPDQNVRTYMYWEEGDFEGKCNNPTGTTICNYTYPSAKEQLEDENSILNYYKKTNYLRNKFLEIARGEILDSSMVIEEEGLVKIDKEYNNSKISILFNFNGEEYKNYNFANTEYNEVAGQLVTDTSEYIGLIGDKNITLPPYSIAILK